MKHYLRFMITLILATVWSLGGYAQTTVTFDATKDKSATETLTKEGVSIILEKGSNNSSGKLNNGTDYRAYSGNNLIVKSSVGNITQIVFTCTAKNTSKGGPGCLNTPSLGDYTYSLQTGTWKGSANSVSFKTSNQVKASKIVVTIAASKKLTSLVISGTPSKKTYNVGDPFDPKGLVVTGTYDDESSATITDGITWATTPETLSFGTTSCSVTATVGDITSAPYSVTGLTVVAPTTLSFDQSSVALTTLDLSSFTGQTPTLTAGDETLTGKSFTYSKSGDDIFSSFNEKTGVLALNGNEGTATVTAKFAGDGTYASTTGSYTIKVNKVYSDLASFKNAIPSTASSSAPVSFSLKLTDAIVTYVNGTDAYVQDATTGVFLYDSSKKDGGNAFDLTAGQKFTGEIDVTACMYNGMAEVMAWTPAADVVKEENVEIPVKTVTLSELNGSDYSKYECVRVKVENATVTSAYSTAKKATITQGDQTYLIHGEVSGLDVNQDDVCDFVGYPIYWKTKNLDEHQLSIWSQDDIIVKSSVVATTLSFNSDFDATKTYTFRNGVAPSEYTKPTVTVNPTEATGKVTYKSSDTDVVEIGEDGTLNFAGKTKYDTEATITAQFIGTGNYTNSEEISYKVKNVEAKATLAFSESTVTVVYGKESEFIAPTLTLLDAEGNEVKGQTLLYDVTPTNSGVVEINDETGEITKWIKPGNVTIVALVIGGDYDNMSASYSLNYEKANTTIEFVEGEHSVDVNKSLSVKAVLKANDVEVSDATVSYSSSDEKIATVDENGNVNAVAEGNAKITAAFAGNDYYNAATSVEYDINVKDPNKIEVTFDFTNPTTLGYSKPSDGDGTDLAEGATITQGDVTFKNEKNASTATRFWNKKNTITLRAYQNTILSLSVPAGYNITKIVYVDGNKCANFTCDSGTLTKETQTWEGNANCVTMNFTNAGTFSSMTVSYTQCPEVVLDEDSTVEDFLNLIIDNADKVVNAKLIRTMVADGGWYTFSVPFNVADVNTTELAGAQVRKYKSMNGSIMEFEATTELKAGHAYLVKPTKDVKNPVFKGVTLYEGDNSTDGDKGYEFNATLGTTDLATDGTNLFLGPGNKFYIPTEKDHTLKALRGYFVAPSRESGALMSIRIDDTTTSIAALNGNAATTNGKVYNLSGQYVGNDVKALPKGVYIVNGRKYIVK